jgi:hypothetical protein
MLHLWRNRIVALQHRIAGRLGQENPMAGRDAGDRRRLLSGYAAVPCSHSDLTVTVFSSLPKLS